MGVEEGQQCHLFPDRFEADGDGMGDQPAEGPAEQVMGAVWLDLADFGEVIVRHLLDRAGRVLGVAMVQTPSAMVV